MTVFDSAAGPIGGAPAPSVVCESEPEALPSSWRTPVTVSESGIGGRTLVRVSVRPRTESSEGRGQPDSVSYRPSKLGQFTCAVPDYDCREPSESVTHSPSVALRVRLARGLARGHVRAPALPMVARVAAGAAQMLSLRGLRPARG